MPEGCSDLICRLQEEVAMMRRAMRYMIADLIWTEMLSLAQEADDTSIGLNNVSYDELSTDLDAKIDDVLAEVRDPDNHECDLFVKSLYLGWGFDDLKTAGTKTGDIVPGSAKTISLGEDGVIRITQELGTLGPAAHLDSPDCPCGEDNVHCDS